MRSRNSRRGSGRHSTRARSEIARLQQEIDAVRRELDATRTHAEALRGVAERVPDLQTQLERSQNERRRQFERAPYALCRCSQSGAITDANHSFVTLLGCRRVDELRNMDFVAAALDSAGDLGWLLERARTTRKTETVETHWKTWDGRRLVVRLQALATTAGSIDIVAEDITGVRALEERLRQAQRMEAVGRLASEVAVTCDALLSDVALGAHEWLARVGSDDALRRHAERLLTDVTRAASFLRQLGTYGNEQVRALEPVSAQRVLRDLAPVLKRLVGDQIELVLPKSAGSFNVDVEAERLERVLINVAGYARERMPSGGQVRIDLATTAVGRRFVARYSNVRPGDHVLITVTELPAVGEFRGDSERSSRSSDKPGVDLGVLVDLIASCGGHLWLEAQPAGNMVVKIHLPKPPAADATDNRGGRAVQVVPFYVGSQRPRLAESRSKAVALGPSIRSRLCMWVLTVQFLQPHDPRPLRSLSHRLPARRRRPHGALQLALRPPARRHVRPAHRGHRRRALVGGDGHGHPRRPALARPRLGRRARTSAGRTRRTSSPSGSSAIARWPSDSWPSGRAYYCYCTTERLQAKREAAEAAGGGWMYDRDVPARSPPDEVARARGRRRAARRPLQGARRARRRSTICVHGPIAFDNAHIEDFVILRSDGQPTYHLSVVVDDIDMAITHVVRGDDHISNTPKQVLLYQALGAPLPQFAHVPLILGPDKKRLSKRHGATSVMEYERQGYLPEAMVNFLALLGWSPGSDRGALHARRAGRALRARGHQRRQRRLQPREARLVQPAAHLRLPTDDLAARVQPLLRRRRASGATSFDGDRARVVPARARAAASRARRSSASSSTTAGRSSTDAIAFDDAAVKKHLAVPGMRAHLHALSVALRRGSSRSIGRARN